MTVSPTYVAMQYQLRVGRLHENKQLDSDQQKQKILFRRLSLLDLHEDRKKSSKWTGKITVYISQCEEQTVQQLVLPVLLQLFHPRLLFSHYYHALIRIFFIVSFINVYNKTRLWHEANARGSTRVRVKYWRQRFNRQ